MYLRDIHSCERTQQPSRLLCFEEKIFFSFMDIFIPLGSCGAKVRLGISYDFKSGQTKTAYLRSVPKADLQK